MSADLTAAIHQTPDDRAVWDTWFREIYPQVLYLAARRASGDMELAEEATQGAIERFLRYRAYERVDSDRSAIAYLVRTAVRLMIDERRRRERESPAPEEVLVDRGPHTVIDEKAYDLKSLLSYVSKDERLVLELVLAGYSVREISEALKIGYSTRRNAHPPCQGPIEGESAGDVNESRPDRFSVVGAKTLK